MLVGPNLASTARNEEGRATRGHAPPPPLPQKNFGFQPHLERFWWVLVVCSTSLLMESICALAWACGWALTVCDCVRRETRKILHS